VVNVIALIAVDFSANFENSQHRFHSVRGIPSPSVRGMKQSKNEKVILITGATRGLGRALAEEFARLGHTVLGCGTSERRVRDLESALGRPHDFATVDVAGEEAVRVWMKRLIQAHGPPDLVLNNAGVINRNAPLWELTAREFDRVIDVNVKGVTHVIRHVLPAMIRRGSGVIVNFSSGWGRSTSAEVAPYCASKWAIEGLTQALAEELPGGLAAVPVNPGIINTEMLQSCFGHTANAYPAAAEWARTAAPFFLELGPKDNGRSLTAP
jgi:NAD(P)-dependent dehydrogenase (short-subunit alcohol dehydrogenase family)